MHLLIAGCGDIGTELGVRLADRGHSVHGLRRQADRIPAPMVAHGGDLLAPETLSSLPATIDTVVYTATPDQYDETAYRAAYVTGLTNLLAALPSGGRQLKRLVFVSSTSVYDTNNGDWVNEDTPVSPAGFSGRTLLEAEAVAGATGTAVVVRFGGIYGPGRDRLLQTVRAGGTVVSDPPRWTNRIHREDCIRVLEHLLALPTPAPLYVAVDNSPSPMHVVTDWLADTMGVPRLGHVSGSAGRRRGGNKRCSNKRLLDSGYAFRYPDFREGYGALLSAMSGS